VSPWKVILATLAIFIAGLITGSVMVKTLINPMPPRPVPQNPVLLQPGPIREEFVRRMTEELELTPEQREKVLHIVHESQERTKLLYSLIGDDVQAADDPILDVQRDDGVQLAVQVSDDLARVAGRVDDADEPAEPVDLTSELLLLSSL